jgi:hypothetical protein
MRTGEILALGALNVAGVIGALALGAIANSSLDARDAYREQLPALEATKTENGRMYFEGTVQTDEGQLSPRTPGEVDDAIREVKGAAAQQSIQAAIERAGSYAGWGIAAGSLITLVVRGGRWVREIATGP